MSEGRSSSWVPNELRWLTGQIRPLLHLHLGSFLCITAGSLLGILTPLVLKWMIDRVIPGKQTGLLLVAMVLIFLSAQGKTVATNLGGYLMLTAAQRMSLELRMSLLRHLDSLSADFYESTPVGTVIYPLREPIDEIAYFGSDLVPAILRTLLTTGFTLATMFTLSPVLTVVIVPFIPVFLLTRQHFRKQLAANSDIVQRDLGRWCSLLEEHVAAAIPIQLLGRQRQEERRAFRLLAWTVRSQQQLFRTGVWFTMSTSLAIVLAMSAVVGYGGWRVVAGTLSLGSLVAFYSFVTQLFDPLSGAAELYSRAQKTFASVRQIQTVMGVRPSVVDAPAAIDLPPKAPAQIDFVGVGFGYARKKAMLEIPSLRFGDGERVAIIGENGAGKSTLAKLIARIYDVDRGSVSIGGEDVRNLRLQSLRRYVSYLPRDPILFDGTLASNLKFVRPTVPEQAFWKVLECAGLTDLVRGLPKGLHQSVGPGACQLSGGERQRLALARALLQQPEILILDEATSCLDPSSETNVLQNVASYLGKSTLIVISHRLSTLSIFSRVIVLSEGHIVRDENSAALLSCWSPSSKLFHPNTATAD